MSGSSATGFPKPGVRRAIKPGVRGAAAPFVATFDGEASTTGENLLKLLRNMVQEDSGPWSWPGRNLSQQPVAHAGEMAAYLAGQLSLQDQSDLNSGLRVFKKDIISRYLHLCSDRFSFSTTSTLVFLNRGYPLAFVPIEVRRRHGKSTVSLMTGYETILLILRTICLFDPLRIFIPASVALVAAGVLLGIYPYFILKRGPTTGSVLVILSGILVFFFGLLADQSPLCVKRSMSS